LSPVQQGREFDSLDTASNAESQKQPVKMSLYGAPRHIELGGNLGVVATLQKQLNDLLLSRTKPNGLLLHLVSPLGPKFRREGEAYSCAVCCIRIATSAPEPHC